MTDKNNKENNKKSGEGLASYRHERDTNRIPEPFGSGSRQSRQPIRFRGPQIFVVQKHASRRLHYDFRLQFGSILLSWAIPKGPSMVAGVKRLAVQVEDHPIEYADFEGIIAEGNTGAGSVIVWDRGRWKSHGDPGVGYQSGDLKFELLGHKLRGEFVLVRTSGRGELKSRGLGGGEQSHWLLIKKADSFAIPSDSSKEAAPLNDVSILSGMKVEELANGRLRTAATKELLVSYGAVDSRVDAKKVRVALCQVCEKPFTDPNWLFEIKYDGYRLIAAKHDGVPFLRYRGGSDVTDSFPEIAAALRALPVDDVVVDGELVCFDECGRSEFARLQKRAMLTRRPDVERARNENPATLVAFDLLSFEGLDTRSLPLLIRKEILAQLVPTAGVVRFADHINEVGEAFYEKVFELGLEGMVAKRCDASYPAGRQPSWLKLRFARTDDFAVVGYRASKKASRIGFGALHLAIYEDGRWIYAGRVGSGFDERELEIIRHKLDGMPRASYGFEADSSRDTWVEPELVAVVRYKEWPASRAHIREPSFLHLRTDKKPTECIRPIIHGDAPNSPPRIADAPSRPVIVTNRDKVYWPQLGATKGDLVDYYQAVSPWLLPYLSGRPVVLTRYPDGIDGKSFFQKDAPTWAPDWLKTKTIWSQHCQREIHYFLPDSIEGLTYLANMGAVVLHLWSSRADDLAHPDWSIIDLDPKGAPFSDVVILAKAIEALLDDMGLPATLKTSGSTGLHILIPLGRQCSYEQSRALAELISQVMVRDYPEMATMNRALHARDGKVYLDTMPNRRGQLLVAPFSARALPGAPVSMPLHWSELDDNASNDRFTIRSAISRMRQLKVDPMAKVLTLRSDLLAALQKLSNRLGGDGLGGDGDEQE